MYFESELFGQNSIFDWMGSLEFILMPKLFSPVFLHWEYIARGFRVPSLPSSYIWWYLVPCRKSALTGFLKKDCISTLVILYANWEQCGGKRKNGGSSVAEQRTKVHPLWKNVWINTKKFWIHSTKKKIWLTLTTSGFFFRVKNATAFWTCYVNFTAITKISLWRR